MIKIDGARLITVKSSMILSVDDNPVGESICSTSSGVPPEADALGAGDAEGRDARGDERGPNAGALLALGIIGLGKAKSSDCGHGNPLESQQRGQSEDCHDQRASGASTGATSHHGRPSVAAA